MTPNTNLIQPAELLKLIRIAQSERNGLDQLIDSYKLQLQQHLDDGTIPPSFQAGNIQARYTERSTWKYSAAVKQLQDLEKMEGVATKSTSKSWTITTTKNASPND